jgi:hypothetical protein
MSDTGMIERVARAIYERRSKRTNYVWPDDVYPAVRNRCFSDARAAIEAARVPTEAMLEAGELTMADGRWDGPGTCWDWMIDAALKEGQ